MPNSIPNDIYQYSLHSAYTAGLQTGGPPVAFLTNHGTYGYGFFADGTTMLQVDRTAYTFSSTGKATKAAQDAQLPFVMVCVFQPERRLGVDGMFGNMTVLRDMFKNGEGQKVNVPIPFAVRGAFSKVKTKEGEWKNVQGTIFGFAVPKWASGVSGGWDGEKANGLRCAFLSGDKGTGGTVEDFECVTGSFLEFAKMGRFHLGMPFGAEAAEFEKMDLA
ncbi:hypothetical protein B0A48_03462 [Cryoendolithus antarcticus]|uniref:Alpha-acetolactate decarboxylase n=1 Tax=Cryoendolithus antarcticus TaxID=1507870 RepID=A0A1V8TK30_9PEZI|nr:hypothetical protein B0A48_03462 [Cryoendolithus antarcticus]